jgi:MoxR-like ATPase
MDPKTEAVQLDPGNAGIERLLDNIDRIIVGKRAVAERLVCALIAGGHVLLEDVPGVGKTLLAKTLAQSLSLGFSRVQFTPDLLPSDVLGVSVFDPGTRLFSFRPGPIFTNLLLADEINRTSPRTQSALLEVMEEEQVTVDGHTYPVEPPFMVVATENPIEYAGTFPLPEAQLDRFLFRLHMGYPTPQEEVNLLQRAQRQVMSTPVEAVMSQQEILDLRRAAGQVRAQDSVLRYLAMLSEHTRDPSRLYLGASPRAMVALLHASQAWALMHGRSYVIPDDVRLLAPDVLVHRLIPRGGVRREGQTVVREIVADILSRVPVPAGSDRS